MFQIHLIFCKYEHEQIDGLFFFFYKYFCFLLPIHSTSKKLHFCYHLSSSRSGLCGLFIKVAVWLCGILVADRFENPPTSEG